MRCPKCGSKRNRVNDKAKTDTIDWRRHKCHDCGHRWTTSECEDDPLMPFDHLKIPTIAGEPCHSQTEG